MSYKCGAFTAAWEGVAVTVEPEGLGKSCWQKCRQLPCGLKMALNSQLHNLSFSRLSPNCLSSTRDKAEDFSARANSLREPRDVKREKHALPLALLLFVTGRWWSGSALWPGWQEKQVPALGCARMRAEGVEFGENVLRSHLLPFSSYLWWHHPVQGVNTLSPFAAPSSPAAFLPIMRAQRTEHGGTQRSFGLFSLLFLCAEGLKAPALKRCLCLQQALAAPALSLLGAAGGGAAAEQMVPVGGFGGLLDGRLGRGVPFQHPAGGGLACLSHGQFPAERLYGIMLLFI